MILILRTKERGGWVDSSQAKERRTPSTKSPVSRIFGPVFLSFFAASPRPQVAFRLPRPRVPDPGLHARPPYSAVRTYHIPPLVLQMFSFVARRALDATAAAASAEAATGASGSNSAGGGGGLGTGAKAGIGIGVAAGIMALAAAGYFQRRARLRRRAASSVGLGDEKHVGGQEGGQDGTGTEGTGKGPVICEGGTCNKLRMVGA